MRRPILQRFSPCTLVITARLFPIYQQIYKRGVCLPDLPFEGVFRFGAAIPLLRLYFYQKVYISLWSKALTTGHRHVEKVFQPFEGLPIYNDEEVWFSQDQQPSCQGCPAEWNLKQLPEDPSTVGR